MFDPSLWNCLRHPTRQLITFHEWQPRLADLPYLSWSSLVAIAFGGSCLYGSSLSLVIPGWQLGTSALTLTLSAGLAWCVFGSILILTTKINAFTCAHACLVTMTYGEVVLISGALLNLLFLSVPYFSYLNPVVFNLAWVGLSNIIMAIALAVQLMAVGVPYWKTLLIWTLVLNSSGLLFFNIFRQILEKGC